MSNRNEFVSDLARSAEGLEIASNAAMTSLGLAPGEFAWFSGDTLHSMEPQRIIPDSELEHATYSSHVTLYGGRAANEVGKFVFGHIQAHIAEPIPEGAKHQSGSGSLPAPYITRLLEAHEGVIMVDTPTTNPSLNDGPLVVEGSGHNPRFRKTTLFNTATGSVTVKSGEHFTHGHGWGDDRTIEQDALELSDDILLPRLATAIRTVKTTAAIFTKIATRSVRDVSWQVTQESPMG